MPRDTAVDQIQGGADAAHAWLPPKPVFSLVPVLVHGKGLRREQLRTLRRARIKLRGQTKQVVTLRCGAPLREALEKTD